jgi:hypothetical protein
MGLDGLLNAGLCLLTQNFRMGIQVALLLRQSSRLKRRIDAVAYSVRLEPGDF